MVPRSLSRPELERQQLGLGDLGQHVGQTDLLDLSLTNGPSEHDPVLGVLQRLVVAGHRGPDRAPRDAVARLRQAAQRTLEPA